MDVLKTLDGGLVMRRASLDDMERVAAFNSRIHGEDPDDSVAVGAWTRDLFINPPPGYCPGDFVIVEDPSTGEIVSSLNLISQTWSYEGIAFGVGRPELVGTDAAYRNRGIVRKQFEMIHEWSRQRGEFVQAITGIPYFYRQFGYEMGLELGGGRAGYGPQLPKLEEGKEEDYQFRKAGENDLSFLMKMYAIGCRRSMISAVRDEIHWRNELIEKCHDNVNRRDLFVIETREGQPVGCLAMPWMIWGTMQSVTWYELDEGISYLQVTPAVLRFAWSVGKEYAAARGKNVESFGLWFGSDHPAYHVVPGRLIFQRQPYAYYVRVPDLPAFIQRIAPVLEQRLSASACAGHTGELKISFYRTGLRLVFQEGRLETVEAWKPSVQDEGAAGFPDLTFLQMVFGYRTLDEIRYAFVDCWARDNARALLEALFPKKASDVWAIS